MLKNKLEFLKDKGYELYSESENKIEYKKNDLIFEIIKGNRLDNVYSDIFIRNLEIVEIFSLNAFFNYFYKRELTIEQFEYDN